MTKHKSDKGRPHKGQYVAYLRVSTREQGRSGLGLDAQMEAIQSHLDGGDWELIATYTEIESGKKGRAGRPQLDAALKLCKKEKATLIIARIDRLARNVYVTASLYEAGISFICCDYPDMDKTHIYLLSMMAEKEAENISIRTTAALKAAKARGVILGNPDCAKISKLGVAEAKKLADAHAEQVYPKIEMIRRSGVVSLRGIARELGNRKDVETSKGGEWSAQQVKNILKRVGKS